MIGNGVIIDPGVLLGEMTELQERGLEVTPDRLIISERAHLIMPYHQALDHAREAFAFRIQENRHHRSGNRSLLHG